ncbi:MAG TPA: UvrD-helicase domain-containing protein [Humisphaera sp.]|jgi:DNA helicase-2/ATP-dependent DNA helicase PcrA|nr:UvrD-helicase domain-containing protein [Humisphaera sp.]
MDEKQLLADLTAPQREAAMHTDGPLLIIAGAGSGKTRVITRRVAYLISKGVSPRSILAITFTNKAAGEMKSRVSSVLGRPLRDFGQLDQPWPMICTFHSLCLRILRTYATKVGLPPNFSIYDASDQTRVVKEAIEALDLSANNFTPSTIHGTISNAKNRLITADAFARDARDFYNRTVSRVFTKYDQLLHKNNALDFDDLLLRTAFAMRDHPEMLAELQERFPYLMIDEYQDTNHAQYVIAHALAKRTRNICVVGDPDQSIYAWRGADLRNILDFEKDYRDAKVVRLDQNYRSTKTILHIASTLIAKNVHRKEKTLWTENVQGEPAEVYLCQDEHDEAAIITRRLRELHEKANRPWSQMAIFYRINSLSRVMEDSLRRAGVPYQIARGVEFYNRKEIKDVLAYLRVVANPNDQISLERIANVPARGLGDAALKKLTEYSIAEGISLLSAMNDAASAPGVSSKAAGGGKQFAAMVARWRQMAGAPPEQAQEDEDNPLLMEEIPKPVSPRLSVRQIMETIVRESGLEQHYKKIGKEEREELANINELISSAAEFETENPEGTLVDYLAHVSLVSDADHMKGAGGAVTMMTLHAAKGLEFPVVAMIGMEEGILPHSRAAGKLSELEEERRLCFVGITRAQEQLLLSKATTRIVRGIHQRTVTSPFLIEMPLESLKVTDRTGLADLDHEDGYRRPSSRPAEPEHGFRRGQLVRHPKFGLGRIADIADAGQHTRAVVEFNEVGRKTLVLEYAPLELVG